MKRRIMKERSSSDDALIKRALEAAIKAKQLLDDAAGAIRDAVGETYLFARLDSHSMDLDDTIDDIKAVLAGELDDTDDDYVPESRKRFGNKFVRESTEDELYRFYEWLKSSTQYDAGVHVKYYDNEDGSESVEMWFDDRYQWDDDVADGTSFPEEDSGVQDWIRQCKKQAEKNHWDFSTDEYDQEVTLDNRIFSISIGSPVRNDEYIDESSRKFMKESDEETEWFDSYGEMKKNLPMDCILGCSGGGRADDEVDYWVNELDFHVPTEKGLSYVREYGLDDIGPEDVDKYVLWIMCGNIKEEAYEFCRDGSEWDYVDKDAYPEDIDDWGEEDWERFQSEVTVCHLGM